MKYSFLLLFLASCASKTFLPAKDLGTACVPVTGLAKNDPLYDEKAKEMYNCVPSRVHHNFVEFHKLEKWERDSLPDADY